MIVIGESFLNADLGRQSSWEMLAVSQKWILRSIDFLQESTISVAFHKIPHPQMAYPMPSICIHQIIKIHPRSLT